MKKYKVLNLYACLGGNRYKWDEVAKDANIDLEVTAVELDDEAARLYQERFPNDIVIVADAHQYLLDYYKEFDFIWSSPPCPTHSRARYWGFGINGKKPIYPDMKLYEEIIFLQSHFKGKYCVENVIPYYEPLIKPTTTLHRHLIWSNFDIANKSFHKFHLVNSGIHEIEEIYQIDLSKYKLKNKRQILRSNYCGNT
jgi:DNA (cytosine-5)-methyltransferase 1